jgi:hypothetical protein
MVTSTDIRNLPSIIWDDLSVRSALFSFTLTRALVFGLFILGTSTTIVEPDRLFARDAQEVRISLRNADVLKGLREVALRGDSAWYLSIARNGYDRQAFDASTNHNWAFFPLFPVLWRAASKLTGGFLLTGMALSNLLFFLALIVMHKTAVSFGCDPGTADRAVFYISAYPMSYFFSLPMAESLFLLLTLTSFYAAKRGWWIPASIVGALASATRFTGILLLPCLAVLYWQENRPFKLNIRLLGLLLIPLGLLLFMNHLHNVTGNGFAFIDIQAAWGRSAGLFVDPLLSYLRDPLEISYKWDLKLLNFSMAVIALGSGLELLRRREWALALYTLISVILPLSSLTLQSLARYVMVIFPVFLVLAKAGQFKRIDQVIISTFIALLSLLTVLCVLIVTMALS